MRIRAKANGNEFEADDEAAKELIATGIYEKVEKKATKVAPLTTQDIPRQPKRRKSG